MVNLRQCGRLLGTIAKPGGFRAAVGWKPFSITAFSMLRALRECEPGFRTIIDGGANIGQFARAATELYPAASVICFEPDPEVASRLQDNLSDRPQVRVHAAALGTVDGDTTFHTFGYSLASSVLSIKEQAAPAAFDASQSTTIKVPMVALDSAMSGVSIERPSLLKLDLQGSELAALRGAERTLSQIDCVLVETMFESAYREAPSFDAIYNFLGDHGFYFQQPIDALADRVGRIVQIDALFQRRSVGGEGS